jgi:hypothetical protein
MFIEIITLASGHEVCCSWRMERIAPYLEKDLDAEVWKPGEGILSVAQLDRPIESSWSGSGGSSVRFIETSPSQQVVG